MATKTVLTTRRLRLRTWSRSDSRAYHKYCNTSAVMEWLGGVLTPRELSAEIRYFLGQQACNGFTFWVIERKRDKAFVGFCGLVRVTERESTVYGDIEIGWRVRQDLWRRGYAYEAATAVMAFGFTKLGIDRIVSRAASGNHKSLSLMRKLGMRRNRALDYTPPGETMKLLVTVKRAPP